MTSTDTVDIAVVCNNLIWCNPDTPGTPFTGALLVVADSLRILCIAGGLYVLGSIPWILRAGMTRGQVARYVALGLYALTAIDTELLHVGATPSARLLATLAATGFAVIGVHRHLLQQEDQPTVEDGPRHGGR